MFGAAEQRTECSSQTHLKSPTYKELSPLGFVHLRPVHTPASRSASLEVDSDPLKPYLGMSDSSEGAISLSTLFIIQLWNNSSEIISKECSEVENSCCSSKSICMVA